MGYIRKSSIMSWTYGNISSTPDVAGVYVLRDANQTIIYIGSAGASRLRERLLEHWNESDIPGVSYFDWYQTSSTEEARVLEKAWIAEHRPKHNDRY